ncbi:Leucine-rich repeat serine/threonine-protein kinase 1 isoform X1 [Oopsacas minuta]|uniref:non-specific serine/threonine protein kinase n=1 Tax=Oopsacas minuta TaxID=111878 RepID=A0AAV7JDB9_9METZ|nr:Leucine-rich repeat serine/threonine-protein kinase 1 isoform X1 [Oopsacas minuta]
MDASNEYEQFDTEAFDGSFELKRLEILVINAICNNEVDQLVRILEYGADPCLETRFLNNLNYPSDEWRAVHVAAVKGRLECLKVLVKCGARTNMLLSNGTKTSSLAESRGHTDLVVFLKQVEEQDNRDVEQQIHSLKDLMQACSDGVPVNTLNMLLNALLNNCNPLFWKFENGDSPMLAVCRTGDLEKLGALVRRGSPALFCMRRLDNQHTPLHAACEHGQIEVIRVLLYFWPQLLNMKSSEGATALVIAVSCLHLEVIVELIQIAKTREDFKNFTKTYNPPIPDLESKHEDIIPILEFNAQDATGNTALHRAILQKSQKVVNILTELEHIDLDIKNSGEQTPLHMAIEGQLYGVVERLLTKKANTKIKSYFNTCHYYPLTVATLLNDNAMLKLLLSHNIHYGLQEASKFAIDLYPELLVTLLSYNAHIDEELLDDTSDRYVDANLRRPEFAIFCNFTKYSLRDLQVDTLTESLLNLSQKFVMTIPGIVIPPQDLIKYVTKVDVSNNFLTSVPECFYSLNNLFNLDLSFNKITSFTPEPGKWLQLSYLSLANNQLKTLHPELFKLPQLRYCNVNNNELLNLPRQMWIAPVLNKLMLKNNKIQNLPEDIPLNTNSQSMSCFRTSESMDSPVSGEQKFHSRTTIFTKGLQFDFTKTTSCLPKALTHLNLAENILTDLPEELPCLCPDLQVLNLSCNNLTGVSFPTCFPASLLDLNLSSNKITSINCTQDIKLKHKCARQPIDYSASTDLEDFTCNHRNHTGLQRLSRLDLSKNKLNTLNLHPPEKGDKHTEQQQGRRETHENKKKKDKNLICPLLTCLYLSHNELEQVPESVCDTRTLTALHIDENPILELPPKLGQLLNLFQLDRTGLQLVFPPQNILDKNVKDIIGFLWSLQKEAKPYHRIRLMLVGMQKRGKSTLLGKLSDRGTYRTTKSTWQLQRRPKSNQSLATPGISISEWTYMPKMRKMFLGAKNSQLDLQAITFMVWDFGGQDEFQPTHQCFLSKRSIYLVLWNLTNKEEGIDELKGWLLNIQARAPNAPVLIVGTHLDLLTKTERQQIPQMRKSIMQKYGHIDFKQKPGLPNIINITEVSTVTNENVDDLRDTIYNSASHLTVNGTLYNENDKMNQSRQKLLMDQLIPSAYLQMEECIRKMAVRCAREELPRIMEESAFFENLSQIVKQILNYDDVTREMEHALKFLHDNGFLLHYEDAQLKDLYFIDPQWLCDLLAQVVTVREINPYIKDDGLMPINSMYHLFNKQKDFPAKYIDKYIQLLIKFEVVLKLNEETLLIPSFLQPNRPQIEYFFYPETDYLPPIKIHIMVDYIPGGFWARLITRILSDEAIKDAILSGCAPVLVADKLNWVKWRNGLELSCCLDVGEICLAKLYEKQEDQLGFKRKERKAWIKYEAEFEEYTAREFETYALMLEIPDNFPTLLKYNKEQGQVLEKMQDKMRATILTKLTYHTKVLIDDWYQGMSPAKILISCPFCLSQGKTDFSRYRGVGEIEKMGDPMEVLEKSGMIKSMEDEMQKLDTNLENVYFFSHEHILVETQKSVFLECPNHGKLPLSIVAPDAIFTHLGTELLVHPTKLAVCKLLGKGAYGHVYKARICSDDGPVRGCAHGEGVAVKMMVKYNEQRIEEAITQLQDLCPKLNNFGLQNERKINYKVYEEVMNAHDVVFKEASYLLSLKNPYVVSLIGICLFPISLILELAPMSSLENLLYEYDKRGLRLSQMTCHQTILLITKGLKFIHRKNVIYRDLKASNVLVWKFPLPTDAEGASTDVSLKISDYGVSQFANFGGLGWAGTPGYMAPEIVSHVGSQLYTTKVDIFSLGMTIYEVITLHPPFSNLQDIAANQEVVNNNRPLLTTKDTSSSILMRELMVWCWQQDPAKRPSAEEVHEVLNSWEFLALQGGIKLFNKGVISCASVFCINEMQVPESPIQSLTYRDVVPDIARQKSSSSEYDTANFVNIKIDTNDVQLEGINDPVVNKPVRSALKKKNLNPTIRLSDCLIRTESIQESILLETPNKQIWEIWVCGGGKYTSQLSVLKYKDKFTSIEDIYLGSAACTCLRKVNDHMWVGFEEGFIQIFDARSRKLKKKIWIEPGIPVICIEWCSKQFMVLIVVANGNIFEHYDNIDLFESIHYEASLFPFINQRPSISLAITIYSAVSVYSENVGNFLWLGIEQGNILVVNTDNWKVEEIGLNIVTRKSVLPCVHLVTMPSKSLVFGSLSYTTNIIKWNAETMLFESMCDVSSYKNIGKRVEDARVITNLHTDSSKVYVGLNVGTMLILNTDLAVLASYYGHEGSISQVLTLEHEERDDNIPEDKKKVLTFGLNYHRYFNRKKQMEDGSPQNLLVWELEDNIYTNCKI